MNVQNQSSVCEPTPQPQIDKPALKKLIISSFVCLLFMIAETVGGILANSLAVGTDAAHLLVDLISFLISISSVCLAARRPNSRLNFGWYRAEAIGALFSVMFIWVVTMVLVGLAILRIKNGEFEIDCRIMLITSTAGVVLNIVMMIILQGGGGGHHHHFISTDHQRVINENQILAPQPDSFHRPVEQTSDSLRIIHSDQSETVPLLNGTASSGRGSSSRNKPQAGVHVVRSHVENINVRAAFIHVLGDMVQSIGVVVAALIIYFKPDYKIADPICTFFFSFLVLCTTIQILRDTILILMEGSPKHVNHGEIMTCLSTLPRVISVHNLRVWVLKHDKLVASVHLVLERRSDDETAVQLSNKETLIAARRIFEDLFKIEDSTIQIEEHVEISPEGFAQSWAEI